MYPFINKFLACPKKYLTILGGSIYFISLGSIGITSTATPYYMSYLHNRTVSEQARYPNTVYLLTVQLVTQALAATLSSSLMSYLNFSLKQLALVGSIFLSLGYVLSYFTLQHSFILFCLTYGFLFGLGFGFTFIAPFSLGIKWFPKSQGKVSSVILVGIGVGSLVFPEFATYYINPNNLSPNIPYSDQFLDEKYFEDQDLLDRVPFAFCVMGFMCLSLNLVGLLMMSDRADTELLTNPDNYESIELIKDTSKPVMKIKNFLALKEFYLLVIINSFNMVPSTIFTLNYKNYGQTFIKDDKFLTLINSVGSIINIPARLVWGFIVDKLPFKIGFLIIITSNMVLLFTVCFNEYFGDQYSYMMYFVLIDFLQSGALIILPKAYVMCFGQENILLTHGLIQLLGLPLQSVQAILVPPIVIYFGYDTLFPLSNVFCAIAWICAAIFSKKDKYGNDI